ncbi:MarR family transcriptional regulator [Thermodesulfobacteriota bacterium]
MTTRVLRIGIITKEDYMQRTIAIAKGEYKLRKDEPKVWFESTKSMSQVLSTENQELLRIILEARPRSITELGGLANRKKSNLSRTLKTLEKYGIVELKKAKGKIEPRVKATDFRVEFGLHYSSPTRRETRV